MEKKISKTEALNKPLVSSTATRRQELATEAMKLFWLIKGDIEK